MQTECNLVIHAEKYCNVCTYNESMVKNNLQRKTMGKGY